MKTITIHQSELKDFINKLNTESVLSVDFPMKGYIEITLDEGVPAKVEAPKAEVLSEEVVSEDVTVSEDTTQEVKVSKKSRSK